MYVNADGVDSDHARARELAERGCAEHDARACNVLGYLLERGLGGAVDPRRALEHYRAACHGGEMRSCYNLGRAHHYGVNGAPKDDARAAVLFVRACQTGLPPACTAAASLADSDPIAQLRYYEIACRAGEDEGCRGLVAGHARRVAAQPESADLWNKLEAACDGGSADSCKALGDLHSLGFGEAADEGQSAHLYQRACKLGSVDGCARQGSALLDAGAQGSERQRAIQLLDDGCRVGDIWACLRLRRLDGSEPGIDAPL